MSGRNRNIFFIAVMITLIIAIAGISVSIENFYQYNFEPHTVNITVSPSNLSVGQGKSLTFMINKSTDKYPMSINDVRFQYGIRLQYVGTNLTSSSSSTGNLVTEYGYARISMSKQEKTVSAKWNGTVENVINGSMVYSTAPAGYYILQEGGMNVSTMPNVHASFSFSHRVINVTGVSVSIVTNETNSVLNLSCFKDFKNNENITMSAYTYRVPVNDSDRYNFTCTIISVTTPSIMNFNDSYLIKDSTILKFILPDNEVIIFTLNWGAYLATS